MSTEVDVGRIVESTNVHCKLRVLMSYKTRYGRRHKTILGRDMGRGCRRRPVLPLNSVPKK